MKQYYFLKYDDKHAFYILKDKKYKALCYDGEHGISIELPLTKKSFNALKGMAEPVMYVDPSDFVTVEKFEKKPPVKKEFTMSVEVFKYAGV